MISYLSRTAEELLGIKTDSDDAEKLHAYLYKTYGTMDEEIIKKVFLSGEAADFLTVSETYFFREPAHFMFLTTLLPSFEKTGLKICSAATATGCEAYSIAMVIEAYNNGRGTGNRLAYHIDAFDINPKVIETACSGKYGGRSMREDGSCLHHMAEPYIKKLNDGKSAMQEYQVEASLGKNIRFFVHNIMNPLPSGGFDIIFFRNAFIYFSPQNRERILSHLSAALKPGGILFLGVSETAGAHHADFTGKNSGDVFYFIKQ